MFPWIPDLTNPQECFIRAAINAAYAKALENLTDPISKSAAQYHATEAVYFTAHGLKAQAIQAAQKQQNHISTEGQDSPKGLCPRSHGPSWVIGQLKHFSGNKLLHNQKAGSGLSRPFSLPHHNDVARVLIYFSIPADSDCRQLEPLRPYIASRETRQEITPDG